MNVLLRFQTGTETKYWTLVTRHEAHALTLRNIAPGGLASNPPSALGVPFWLTSLRRSSLQSHPADTAATHFKAKLKSIEAIRMLQQQHRQQGEPSVRIGLGA